MKPIKILTAVIISAAALTSCKKMSGSNSGIEFQLTTINRTSIVSRTDATGTIQWTSGSATASQIKFEAKNNNSEVEFKNQNPGKVDLFASIASFGNVTLPAGSYSEVEFKIELNPNGIDPALQLDGTFTNSSSVSTPVELLVNSLLEIKSEQNNVTTVTDNSSFTALTTLDLSQLSTGITQAMLNTATITGGKIIISSSSNTNLFNIILNNFQMHHEVEIRHH